MTKNPNIELLRGVAEKLTPLLGEVVFVGGCATGLLVTDTAAAAVRTTYDVDVIAEIVSYAGLVEFSERLEKLGFARDTSEGAPVCRWVFGKMKLDVMPLDEALLGFSNRWYKEAMQASEAANLPGGPEIRLITAPYFVATKLEAFAGRGKGDFYFSHDLEDMMTVIDGRPALAGEVKAAEHTVRRYIAGRCKELIENSKFRDAVPGYLLPDVASQARISNLLSRLEELVALGGP